MDVIETGLRQGHEQVDERLEIVEVGLRNIQEDLSRIRADVLKVERYLRGDFVHLQEEFSRLSQQLNVVLAIFSRQPNASLPKDFPPRATVVPIILEARGR